MMTSKQTSRSIKKAYWQKHNESWQASGLTQQKYCEQENINLTTFGWWCSKGLKNKTCQPSKFIPAVIKESVPIHPQTDVQIIFPNQVKIMLPSNLSVDALVSLVKRLGGLS